jgi:hypothetical protein
MILFPHSWNEIETGGKLRAALSRSSQCGGLETKYQMLLFVRHGMAKARVDISSHSRIWPKFKKATTKRMKTNSEEFRERRPWRKTEAEKTFNEHSRQFQRVHHLAFHQVLLRHLNRCVFMVIGSGSFVLAIESLQMASRFLEFQVELSGSGLRICLAQLFVAKGHSNIWTIAIAQGRP